MTFAEIKSEALRRCGEDPAAPAFYTAAEAGRAVNSGYRIFALLTLCLETTSTVGLNAGGAFKEIGSSVSTFLAPLRVTNADGDKVQPGNLAKLTAGSGRWQSTEGSPLEYAMVGSSLMVVTPQPTAAHNLSVLHAYLPAAMSLDGDIPAIPDEDHEALVHFAAHDLLSSKEGASRLQDAAVHWQEYIAAVQARIGFVRARAMAEGYDRMPIELRRT